MHPSTRELVAFLAADRHGQLGPAAVVQHLLAGCAACSRRLRRLDKRAGAGPGWRRPLPHPEPAIEIDYDQAFADAERTLDIFLADGKPVDAPPGVLLAELADLEPAPSEGGNRLAIPFLTRWLVAKSHAARYSNPEEMLHWALMARLAACGCAVALANSEAKLADLRAASEAQLSNALRVLGRVEEAEDTMRTAWRHLERGTGDPELRAGVFKRAASLFTLQKQYPLAIELSCEAAATFKSLGLTHRSASAKVTGAIATLYSGDPERASRLFSHLLPEIDPEEDPTLLLAAQHNLICCYLDLGEHAKADAVYRNLQGNRRNIEPLILLRMEWQESLILDALQGGTAALQKLGRVRAAYIERRLAREAIVVTRDLARMLEHLGEGEKASRLREETACWLQRMRFGVEMSQFFAELQQAG